MLRTNREQYQRIRAIFDEVCDRPHGERAAYLDSRCGDDPDLRTDVEALLAHYDTPGIDFDEVGSGLCELLSSAASESSHVRSTALPEHIGPYRILRLLGEGGMGVVYLAEQDHPKRTVALKIIRPGFTTPTLMRRFELEANILGRLQHPGIAHIHAASTAETEYGTQPYLAMEYIDGQPLLEYAAIHGLTTEQRLSLFLHVCTAVEHAHQKGVIHRDLKPANILVDASGQPKVLDFGVARATNPEVKVTTIAGGGGQLIGTLPYMSPEQIAGEPDDVDTRCDVYAMGVILFELLSGRLPYRLNRRSVPELSHAIREQPPMRLGAINRAWRGDLETIVAKVLEKDCAQRYQSVAQMGADLRRLLANEPIAARSPSATYQIRTFAKRNKALVAGVFAVLLALLVGLTGTGLALIRALNAESELERRAALMEQVVQFQQEQLAWVDVATMGERLHDDILDKYKSMMASANADTDEFEARHRSLSAMLGDVNFTDVALRSMEKNIFDDTLQAIEKQFESQPLVRARLLQATADTMRSIGLLDAAEAPQRSALELYRTAFGNHHPDTLNSLNSMGTLHFAQQRLDDAEACLLEASEISRQLLGVEHPRTLTTLNLLGSVLRRQGRLAEVEPIWTDVLSARRRTLGNEHEDTLTSMHNMGLLMAMQGRLAEAEEYWLDLADAQRSMNGDQHPEFAKLLSNLAGLMHAQGKLGEAERYLREAIDTSGRLYGDEHPDTLPMLNNMNALLLEQGKYVEAEPSSREAVRVLRRVRGEHHPHTLVATSILGTVLRELGQLEEAESFGAEVVGAALTALPPDHADADLAAFLADYGRTLLAMKRFEEAEHFLLEAFEAREASRYMRPTQANDIVESIIDLYDTWHRAEPDAGLDILVQEWQQRAAQLPIAR